MFDENDEFIDVPLEGVNQVSPKAEEIETSKTFFENWHAFSFI